MPIYEYICEQCQKRAEVIQKLGEDAPERCPECGAKGSLRKAVTSSTFLLKGGGWHKDLYSSTKPDPAGKANESNASPTQTKKDDKVEKKSKKDDPST